MTYILIYSEYLDKLHDKTIEYEILTSKGSVYLDKMEVFVGY